MVHRHRQRERHDPLSGKGFGNPVTGGAGQQRTSGDAEQVHLTGHRTVDLEHEREQAPGLRLAILLAHHLRERHPRG